VWRALYIYSKKLREATANSLDTARLLGRAINNVYKS